MSMGCETWGLDGRQGQGCRFETYNIPLPVLTKIHASVLMLASVDKVAYQLVK